MIRLLFFLAAIIALWSITTPVAATDYDKLGGGRKIGNATILFTESIESGSFAAPGQGPIEGLPKFCRIVASATPSPASNIVIEVWLPERGHWNGKILGTGNGGFAGAIRYSALAGGVKRGYAVANTDLGTYPAALPSLGYAAGNGRPEAVKDWGHRATHEMALLSKELVLSFYGSPARHAYFAGCSTGGHQGLMEAQRYPDDYDAILAGAPGHNRTHLHAMFTDLMLKLQRPGANFTREQLKLWTDTLIATCAGKDGGAPEDTFLTDPTQCTLSPRTLLCTDSQSGDGCLQEGQIAVLEAIYDGTRNPRTGELIYPPPVRGTESMLSIGLTDPNIGSKPVPEDLNRWVFGPQWDASSFDFDNNMARVDAALGLDINALDSDLSRFAARGGKLILFHGWTDLVVSPIDTILYYENVHATGHDKADFVRLFMAPGVGHCSGGAGPDVCGQGAEVPENDSDHDLLTALDRWVETGNAPEIIIASKYAAPKNGAPPAPDAQPIATRPLCAYPLVAHYNGSGEAADAASFTCSSAPPARYERPADKYLK